MTTALSVSGYRNIQKGGKVFTPLRAVGLAVESCHKLARDVGLGNVKAADVSYVVISGEDVKVKSGSMGRWRKTSCKVKLSLTDHDSELAVAICKRQRAYLADLRLNVWAVDPRVGGGKTSPDLVADYSDAAWPGLVSIELKAFGLATLNSKIKKAMEEFETNFAKLGGKYSSGILLVITVSERRIAGAICKRYIDGQWMGMGKARKKGRGRVQGRKRLLAAVWRKMEWFDDPRGGRTKLGLLGHFLEALELPGDNAAARAPHFNDILEGEGMALEQIKIPNREGKPPWMGTKAAFRAIHKTL